MPESAEPIARVEKSFLGFVMRCPLHGTIQFMGEPAALAARDRHAGCREPFSPPPAPPRKSRRRFAIASGV